MPNEMPQGGETPDGGFDIFSILGTSGQSDTAGGSGVDVQKPAQGDTTQPGGSAFKFANKSWESQQKAEEFYNKLYGKHSEAQGLINKLKAALKDPEDIAELAQDPEWADILAKLGIDVAAQNVDDREAADAAARPQTMQEFERRFATREATFDLKMERRDFEQSLGRKLAKDEENAILDIISDSPSLSYERAYKLAFHDKLMKEAIARGQTASRPKTGRPAPPPSLLSGQKLDLKNPIHEMSKEAAREARREDIRAGLRG